MIWNKVSHHKKSCWYLVFFQGFQNFWHITIFITAVKSKVYDFFFCICSIVSIIFFQFFYGSIPNRTFPLSWKLKPQLVFSEDALTLPKSGSNCPVVLPSREPVQKAAAKRIRIIRWTFEMGKNFKRKFFIEPQKKRFVSVYEK